jgi:hypothetical protein
VPGTLEGVLTDATKTAKAMGRVLREANVSAAWGRADLGRFVLAIDYRKEMPWWCRLLPAR